MPRLQVVPAVLAAAGLTLLAACGDAPDRSAAADGARQAVKDARQEAREATAAARATPRNAVDPSSRDADAARTASMGAAPAPAPAGNKAADAQITAKVNAGLAQEKELRGIRIDVDTQDGVVTLSGSVPSASVRARAGEIAHSVKDVRSVNDQLTLAGG